MSVLSHIRRYRELRHACESGGGLEMAEVLSMEELGSLLRTRAAAEPCPSISAILTKGNDEYSVGLTKLGPDTVTCTDCPRILPGTSIGLRLDDGQTSASYLFRAAITSSHYNIETKNWTLHLALVGQPVVLNWARGRAPSSAAVLRLEKNLNVA